MPEDELDTRFQAMLQHLGWGGRVNLAWGRWHAPDHWQLLDTDLNSCLLFAAKYEGTMAFPVIVPELAGVTDRDEALKIILMSRDWGGKPPIPHSKQESP